MGNKEKGANAERELYEMFIDQLYRAVRVAGSGMLDNTSCDLIAGKIGKKFAIECKATKDKIKYITKQQIEDFLIFSEIFGLEPKIAIRFNRHGWFFISPIQLEDSGKYWKASLELCQREGKRFGQVF
ncbi:MAG: Holliday junction resolvase Hjc [Nanoarchaeota archaeon]